MKLTFESVVEKLKPETQNYLKSYLEYVSVSSITFNRRVINPFKDYNSEGFELKLNVDTSGIDIYKLTEISIVTSWIQEVMITINMFITGVLALKDYRTRIGSLVSRLDKIIEKKDLL